MQEGAILSVVSGKQTLAAALGGHLGLMPSDHWQDSFFQLACGMPWACLQTEQRDWKLREGRKGRAEDRGDDRAYPACLGLLDHPDPCGGLRGCRH